MSYPIMSLKQNNRWVSLNKENYKVLGKICTTHNK